MGRSPISSLQVSLSCRWGVMFGVLVLAWALMAASGCTTKQKASGSLAAAHVADDREADSTTGALEGYKTSSVPLTPTTDYRAIPERNMFRPLVRTSQGTGGGEALPAKVTGSNAAPPSQSGPR
ncbi:MAG: hypothetical protein ACUVX8_06085, partial [Candidatus Zipacnadales bacterium]